jgi:hypothetical protein
MKNSIIHIIALFFYVFGFSQEVASIDDEILMEERKSPSFLYKPSNVFETPNVLMRFNGTEAIPIEFYTDKEIEIQKELNTKEEGIISFSEGDNRIFSRPMDKEEITPYTWKWIHLRVKEKDDNYTNVYLRRPNWWFLEKGATRVGSSIHLNIPQVGINRDVSVVKIYPNQLDTRLWDIQKEGNTVIRPITGKVEHYANNVVDLHFKGDEQKPLSVTTNHLLWSNDRDNWVAVGDLVEGEKVTTKEGVVTVKERIDKEGWYVVYDLEVYRDHNFLVGYYNVLAHNGCEVRINGRRPRNGSKAGSYVTTKSGKKVFFDKDGFPDFTKEAKYIVKVDGKLSGNAITDGNKALRKIGKKADYDKSKWVWHHHQDGKTMMLVPKELHNTPLGGVGHTGGNAINKHNSNPANSSNQLNYASPTEKH